MPDQSINLFIPYHENLPIDKNRSQSAKFQSQIYQQPWRIRDESGDIVVLTVIFALPMYSTDYCASRVTGWTREIIKQDGIVIILNSLSSVCSHTRNDPQKCSWLDFGSNWPKDSLAQELV